MASKVLVNGTPLKTQAAMDIYAAFTRVESPIGKTTLTALMTLSNPGEFVAKMEKAGKDSDVYSIVDEGSKNPNPREITRGNLVARLRKAVEHLPTLQKINADVDAMTNKGIGVVKFLTKGLNTSNGSSVEIEAE